MLLGFVFFFSIAVTDVCTKPFEKGMCETIEGLSKANMEALLSYFSVLFGGRLELSDQGRPASLPPGRCVLK